MKISTLISMIIPPIMYFIYIYNNDIAKLIVAMIGSISTGVGLSLLYAMLYED